MSEHRPSASIDCDVFPDEADEADEEDVTPEAVAGVAWEMISAWVMTGYLPVMTVRMPDGTEHDVDLAKENEDG